MPENWGVDSHIRRSADTLPQEVLPRLLQFPQCTLIRLLPQRLLHLRFPPPQQLRHSLHDGFPRRDSA